MKKLLNFIFLICMFIFSLPLYADVERKKEIDALNNEEFLYECITKRTRKERKWNGIVIPEQIWKMIDKYRYVIIQDVRYSGPLLPYPYSPDYIAKELKKLVEYNDTFYCSHCDTDIPIYIKHNDKKKKSVEALDGLPMNRVINSPKECPICGVFGEGLVPFTTYWYNDFYSEYKIDLYENYDVWERYASTIMKNSTHYELMSLYQRAAWANRDDDELFEIYIRNALYNLSKMITNEEYQDYAEEMYGYLFHKAELLRQIGHFEDSKKYIDYLVKNNRIEKVVSDFFYDLLDKKNKELAPMPRRGILHMAIGNAEKDEITSEIKELAKDKKLLNDFGSSFYNPLSFAIYLHKTNIARFLIKQGADTNIYENITYDPIPQIIVSNNKELAKLVINKDNIENKYDYNYTPLCYAVETANLDMVKFLVERGASLTYGDDNKSCVLKRSFKLFYNHLEEDYNKIVEYLLTLPQINQSKEILEEAKRFLEYKDEDENSESFGEYEYGTPKMREMVNKAWQKLLEKEKSKQK